MKIEIVNNGNDIRIVDENGNCLVMMSGPMRFAAAGAFIRHHKEQGLVGVAHDHMKK